MKKIEINTTYEVFEDESHLPKPDQELLAEARKSLQHSYSPYSRFEVAAALLLENGAIVPGSNQENASYPLCLCAERVALAAAASQYPGISVKAIAVTARSSSRPLHQPASPCGACRQVMVENEERTRSSMRVILRGERGPVFVLKAAKDLLPLHFSGELLK